MYFMANKTCLLHITADFKFREYGLILNDDMEANICIPDISQFILDMYPKIRCHRHTSRGSALTYTANSV